MLKPQVPLAVAFLALPGCTAIQGLQARGSENILAEAGFKPETLGTARAASGAGATTLPTRQLTRVVANGETVYMFNDPEFCKCAYVGGEKEFGKLQALRKQRLADGAWFSGRRHRSWPEGLDVK